MPLDQMHSREPAEPPRAARVAGPRHGRARLRPAPPDPRPRAEQGLRPRRASWDGRRRRPSRRPVRRRAGAAADPDATGDLAADRDDRPGSLLDDAKPDELEKRIEALEDAARGFADARSPSRATTSRSASPRRCCSATATASRSELLADGDDRLRRPRQGGRRTDARRSTWPSATSCRARRRRGTKRCSATTSPTATDRPAEALPAARLGAADELRVPVQLLRCRLTQRRRLDARERLPDGGHADDAVQPSAARPSTRSTAARFLGAAAAGAAAFAADMTGARRARQRPPWPAS